jgi:hypothetical protein
VGDLSFIHKTFSPPPPKKEKVQHESSERFFEVIITATKEWIKYASHNVHLMHNVLVPLMFEFIDSMQFAFDNCPKLLLWHTQWGSVWMEIELERIFQHIEIKGNLCSSLFCNIFQLAKH